MGIKIKSVLAEYNHSMEFACTTNPIIDKEYRYARGVIIGCWYKKIKRQVLFEYILNNNPRNRYVLFDAPKKSFLEYMQDEHIKAFFSDKLFI